MSENVQPPTEILTLPTREPLIVLPDRRISLVYAHHGRIKADGTYDPFIDRVVTEKELATVFPGGIDGLLTDSFPGIDPLDSAFVKHSLSVKDDQLSFHEWAIKYAASRGATVIAGDPLARSSILDTLTRSEQIAIQKTAARQDEDYSQKFLPIIKGAEYQSLESMRQAAANQRLGTNILLGLEAIIAIAKGIEIYHGLKMNRRQFLQIAGLAALTATTATLKQGITAVELLLSGKQREKIGSLPSQSVQADLEQVMALFARGEELNDQDFQNPAVQRRIILTGGLIITLGLRNALIAEALIQPREKILAWSGSQTNLTIATVMGFDHVMVPEKLRIPYFITHADERNGFIKNIIDSLVVSQILRRELKTGYSYKIAADGSFTKWPFSLPLGTAS